MAQKKSPQKKSPGKPKKASPAETTAEAIEAIVAGATPTPAPTPAPASAPQPEPAPTPEPTSAPATVPETTPAPPPPATIQLIQPPPEDAITTAFLSGLSAFLSGGVADSVETFVGIAPTIPSPAAIGIGSGAVPNAPDIVVSLQAFVLNLKDAANNAGVISPVAAGWRFFAGDSQRTTAILGRVVQRGPGQTWKLAAVHYGDLVSQTLNSLNTLGAEVSKMLTDLVSETLSLLNKDPDMTLLQILGQEYELRMLTLPGLNLEVFWLKANKAGLTDFILPIPSATSNTRLQGGVSGLMEMPKFLASIRPVAASLLKMPQGHGA